MKPGAIIISLYYVMVTHDITKQPFSADDILKLYSHMKIQEPHKSILECILNEFKKRANKSEPKVLTDATILKGWLTKHSGNKPHHWFDKEFDKFILRESELDDLDYFLDFCL